MSKVDENETIYQDVKKRILELDSLELIEQACALLLRGKNVEIVKDLEVVVCPTAGVIKQILDILDEGIEKLQVTGPGKADCTHEECQQKEDLIAIEILLASNGDWEKTKRMLSRLLFYAIPITDNAFKGFHILKTAKHYLKEYNDHKKQSSDAR